MLAILAELLSTQAFRFHDIKSIDVQTGFDGFFGRWFWRLEFSGAMPVFDVARRTSCSR
jgi:hypothetical protein